MGVITTSATGQVIYYVELTDEGRAHISNVLAGIEDVNDYEMCLLVGENVVETGDVTKTVITSLQSNDTIKYHAEEIAVNGGIVDGLEMRQNGITLWKAYFAATPVEVEVGQTWTAEDFWVIFPHDTEPVAPAAVLEGSDDGILI